MRLAELVKKSQGRPNRLSRLRAHGGAPARRHARARPDRAQRRADRPARDQGAPRASVAPAWRCARCASPRVWGVLAWSNGVIEGDARGGGGWAGSGVGFVDLCPHAGHNSTRPSAMTSRGGLVELFMSHMNKPTRPRIGHQSARRPRPRRRRPANSHPLKDAVPARSAGRRTLHRLVPSVHGRPASTHALRAGRHRAADPRALAGVRPRAPRSRRHAGGELLDRDPAAERHRRAAHGPRAELDHPGRPHPHEPHARPAREVDLRHRPRGHRHAAPGREAARDRGHVARRARP